jgi:hypothetical protein
LAEPEVAQRFRWLMTSQDNSYSTSEELEPVRDILSWVQDAQTLASTLLESSEQEFQTLRTTEWPAGSERQRRFRFLCWQRVALRDFINQQALVTQNLRATSNCLSEGTDPCGSSDEETDFVVTATATADAA